MPQVIFTMTVIFLKMGIETRMEKNEDMEKLELQKLKKQHQNK